MREAFGQRRSNGRSFCLVWLLTLAGCSAADPSPRKSQQLGNGTPPAQVNGEGGSASVGSGGGSGNAGAFGSGGTAGGFSGSGGNVGVGGTGTGNDNGRGGSAGENGMGGSFGAGGASSTGGDVGTGGLGVSSGGVSNASGGVSNASGGAGGDSAGGAGGVSTSTGGTSDSDGETGRLIGITAAHNVVRAGVQTVPPLTPLTWSPTIAAYAQSWADTLATTSCASPHHRTEAELEQQGYGENLAAFSSPNGGSTAQQAVNGWAAEAACWTYGTIMGTEQCNQSCYAALNSDGCGHYTQIVWRSTTLVGCGVATCQNGNFKTDIWICNYSPAGNYVGEAPY
jgi:pathogenesis-related protein 1